MPEFIANAVKTVKGRFPQSVVGIHPHNDCSLAVANALAAVSAGAGHVQGTINGVGERCGNLDLIPLIANLNLKYGLECLKKDSLAKLTETSRFVYETANLNIVTGQAYVGPAAFAHKGGMHVHAIQKDSSTYEHVKPELVGNTRRILVSELSGISNIVTKAGDRFNISKDKDALKRVLDQVCQLENKGYQFEAAEASFEMLVRKQIGRYRKFFELDHYRVIVLKTDSTDPVAEATVKMKVGETTEHTVAEGDGPIAALDKALRKALLPHLPRIGEVHLMDYKVRVINSRDETSASVRVIATVARKTADGKRETYGTIGVSENIIDASWQALVEAYEYHLVHVDEEKTK
jgi:2-isopropylmalate synthase